jgi:site-specific recombinase XerC
MRRAKASLIYRCTKYLRAVQLLLGHTNWTISLAIMLSLAANAWAV